MPKKRAGESVKRSALARWCDGFGVGAITHLQRETGLTFAAVHRIVHGRAVPRPENARKLARATNGTVSAAEILGVAEAA